MYSVRALKYVQIFACVNICFADVLSVIVSMRKEKMSNGDDVSEKDGAWADLEQKVLLIERKWWTIAPTREQAIRKVLGFTPMKYYLLLSSLLDCERFWKQDPVLVDRLRRLREAKLQERGQAPYSESI